MRRFSYGKPTGWVVFLITAFIVLYALKSLGGFGRPWKEFTPSSTLFKNDKEFKKSLFDYLLRPNINAEKNEQGISRSF
jgi:hypothetical protein